MGRKPKDAKKEGNVSMTENSSPAVKGETSQPKMQKKPTTLLSPRKTAKNQTVVVRRSDRLQNVVVSTRRTDIEPVIEEIDVSESEKEDEPQVEEHDRFPEPVQVERSWEEKIDHLIQQMEVQKKAIEALSKGTKSPSGSDLTYKSLYIESQKRVESLTDENIQLSKKLENALGKLEVYEKGCHLSLEMLEKLKNVILISNVAKTTEAAINISSRAVHGDVSSLDAVIKPKSSPAKRKRNAKEINET